MDGNGELLLDRRFRYGLKSTLSGLMVCAVVLNRVDEANILLDALVLLDRKPDDLERPVTPEERLAIVPWL
ncbi:MAG: hypothetical protein F4089_00150 [Gammaproteobacteria bacterium]|nr:hypothetical protein [Gammaproteobacteria bacterium]MYJ73575.1 hypothetical protein [Gammaproteobacteria bacterium]